MTTRRTFLSALAALVSAPYVKVKAAVMGPKKPIDFDLVVEDHDAALLQMVEHGPYHPEDMTGGRIVWMPKGVTMWMPRR